ncbi:Arc family DNA-binding protein [Sinorhizobium meliloti]|uniref:Arc family DNA-binding protein n=1 Tax=Rhizobium meliloti TaxID=382 RepID=UPI002380BBF6|nr:Arc family DNA-binding protein [Sinorhizobium meliloti]MDE3796622.1 Arc family DNA-binding protein [Sinorhizobium meliloti]
MSKKPTIQPQDKYVLRLPDGLRDRIKAYAERNGRSMNAEIIRVLEREYPPAWTIAGRVGQMIEVLRGLRTAGATEESVERLAAELQETIEGMMSGRVQGVDEVMRERIRAFYEDMQLREAEDAVDLQNMEYDEEELLTMERIGRPEKYAEPPPKSDPFKDLPE